MQATMKPVTYDVACRTLRHAIREEERVTVAANRKNGRKVIPITSTRFVVIGKRGNYIVDVRG